MTSLIAALTEPAEAATWPASAWTDVIGEARSSEVLGQLAARMADARVLSSLPDRVRRQLELARLTATRRGEAAAWEVSGIRRHLPAQIPLVLLKGCAYRAIDDANADGRMFSDIDVLVPREFLDETERMLLVRGWQPAAVDDYDSRYYREWMHELPPMEHMRRHTTLDLHHAIVPPISRHAFPPQLLFSAMQEIRPGVFVLSAEDRVIHCAVHVVQEGVAGKVLRDLYDLHRLIRQHFDDEDTFRRLMDRSVRLGLAKFVEASVSAATQVFGGKPFQGRRSLLSAWLAAAARQPKGTTRAASTVVAAALTTRAHLMKMPLKYLVPHLAHKTMVRWRERGSEEH